MNFEKLIIFFVGVLMIIAFILMMTAAIDSFTLKEIGEESVPCLDRNNRPFEDEMCTKKIYCSWLGFTQYERCVNVGVSEE